MDLGLSFSQIVDIVTDTKFWVDTLFFLLETMTDPNFWIGAAFFMSLLFSVYLSALTLVDDGYAPNITQLDEEDKWLDPTIVVI